jgi:NADH pyrophosphatase NudC (nudix superfamily)
MHPLSKVRYCPVRGRKHFEEQDEKSKKCDNCGFEYYLNPSAAHVAFNLNERNELLVFTRKKEPARAHSTCREALPTSRETAEQGVIREVREETGLVGHPCAIPFHYPNVYLIFRL